MWNVRLNMYNYTVCGEDPQYLVLSSAKKQLLFPRRNKQQEQTASTRTDRVSPFEAFFGRKADAARDIGPLFGSYCQVSSRTISNGIEARTIGCLYLEPKMNGTGTHSFMRLDNRAVIAANHYTVLPIPDIVITLVNGWASKNKVHTSLDPAFTFHDVDITLDAADADDTYVPVTAHAPDNVEPASAPSQDFPFVIPTQESRGAEEPEPEPILEGTDTTVPPTVLTGPTELTDEPQHDDISPPAEAIGGEDQEPQHEHGHPEPILTHAPVLTPVRTPVLTRSRTQPPAQREPSTRIRRAPERYNLATTSDLTTTGNYLTSQIHKVRLRVQL